MDPIRRSNFVKARHMLCIKMGWMRDYSRFIMHTDPDSCKTQEHTKFIKKVTRFLAFNYDVHRCPDTSSFKSLWPEDKAGSEPVKVPPEYREGNS